MNDERAAEVVDVLRSLSLIERGPRQPTRRKTTSWDPDMPLEDAEPGRYGWRS